ncbi:hypothetical protein [Arthrobacter sp. UCD-GKA]|uniref:hypothetical protein n=1 Tax=Arthrobacter sp. UCD-GKA TaxID=1913576 RepID=UPI0011145340|nr:hypothetical protein [Arthrobacter sp. UCD-GKA]
MGSNGVKCGLRRSVKVFGCRYLSLVADDEDACSRFDDIVDDGVELVEADGLPGGVRYAAITERLHLAIKSTPVTVEELPEIDPVFPAAS